MQLPPPQPLHPPRFAAFTLLELMVAITLFVMVVMTIYSTWMLIIRSSTAAQAAAAQAQRERITIATLESSLMCIQSFQASMKYYSFDVENGPEPVFSFTARLPEGFPRWTKFMGFNLRRLTYSLQPGADQDKDLVLRQNPILLDESDDADQEQSYPLTLAHNVKDFTVECWDTNASDWVTEWDTTNSIPPLVRVSFTLGSRLPDGSEGPPLSLTRIMALPCSTTPAVLQTTHP